MENKVLSENLQNIKRYDSNLANKILGLDYKKSIFSLSKTKNDEYNLLFCNIPLHDENNALQEAQNIAKNLKNKIDKNTVLIVYGLGLGYLIDEISNIFDGKIILYEPNVDILKFVFEIARIDAIFRENVFITTNKEELKKTIENIIDENSQFAITFLNSYKKLFENDIMNVLNFSQKILGEICAKKNIKKRNITALYYTFSNLKKIITNPDITQLTDIYKGKTALVASAGATLAENIETIKKNKDNIVIFAVNQSLNILTENDIIPDFVVNIDAYNNALHFKNLKSEECYFIMEPFSFPSVFNLPTKKTFNYITENNFFNDWLRDMLLINHHLTSSGTVSISAFLSACVMGFSKIILVGQDLAYKNKQCYTKGAIADNMECVFENNKYTIKPKNWQEFVQNMKKEKETEEQAKTRLENYLKKLNQNICTIKSQNGDFLPTQIAYSYFVDYFTELAKILKNERPNLKLINSSTGGAQIDGFENIDLKEALKNASKIEKLDLSKIKPQYDKKRIIEKLDTMNEELEKASLVVQDFKNSLKLIYDELEKENKITQNIIQTLKTAKEQFEIMKNYKTQEIPNCILEKIIELRLKKAFFDTENIESFKENIQTMLKEQPLLINFDRYKYYLANCKSVVLE